MFKGFRWQFIVLVMALLLFVVSFATRFSSNSLLPSPTQVSEQNDITPPTPTALPKTIPADAIPLLSADSEVPSFREALVGTLQRLNPLLADLNPIDRDISSLIYEGLTKVNAYGEPVPALASKWVISSDGLEYVFTLRDDVLWQDGIAFTATDVAFTFSLLQSAGFPGNPELSRFWRTVEIEPLDTYLVRFRLTQSLGTLLDRLTIGILPEHALRGMDPSQLASHPFNLTPIGTGPYQLEAIRTNRDQVVAVDLRAAPVYKQRPEGSSGWMIDRFTFRLYGTFDEALTALRNREVDGLASRSTKDRVPLLSSGGDIQTTLEPTVGMILFNWQKESTRFFRERRVRSALLIGLDRSAIVERDLTNIAVRADSPLVPGSWAYAGDLSLPAPNPTQARQLLEVADASRSVESADSSGAYLRFTLLAPDESGLVAVANDIAAQWGQLNVEVFVETADEAEYQRRLQDGDFDSVLVELSLLGSADPDVLQFWDPGQYPDGKNYGGMDDNRIAEVLERARRDASGINRAIYYRQFQQGFIERAIAIPLYYPLFTYVTSQTFSGVQLGFLGSPSARFLTLRDWTIGQQAG